MGNLFIGFPVPRAKIAEMIEGAAPPLEHKTNHLPDGSDPLFPANGSAAGKLLRWTGSAFEWIAAPSGGIASQYADPNLYYNTNFEHLDGFDVNSSAGASAELSDGFLQLITGDTINHFAYVKKRNAIQVVLANWNNARKFKATVYLYTATNNVGLIYIGTGASFAGRHVMFVVEDGVLKGSVHNGSTGTTVELEDLSAPTYGIKKNLEAIFTPGSKAEFYIDGHKIDEITTNLPSGIGDADYLFYTYLKNTDGTNDLMLRINQFQLMIAA